MKQCTRYTCAHLFATGIVCALLGAAIALAWVWHIGPERVYPAAWDTLAALPAPETLREGDPIESSPAGGAAPRAAAVPPPSEPRGITCFRGNPERNLSGVGPVPRRPRLLWRFRTKTKFEGPHEQRGDRSLTPGTPWYGTGWTGQPCILDGRVYFGSTDSYVYCLDGQTGAEVWHYGNHHSIKGSISIHDGRIYHGGRDNKIHCYTLDGQMVWETRIGQDTDSNPIIARGTLFIGGEDNSVYALDPDTGRIRWRYQPTAGSCESSPCYAEGVIVIGSSGGMLYCLNPSSGKPIWIVPTGGDGDPTPVYMNGRVYHAVETGGAVEGGRVYCIDVGRGEMVWDRRLPRGVWATAAVNQELNRVYIGCNNGTLYCLDGDTGDSIWERSLGSRIWSSPVVTDGCVLVGVRDGTLWCLDETEGAPIWVFDEGFDIDSTPAVADGLIVIGSQNGWVYGIGEDREDGPLNRHWFRGPGEFHRRTDHDPTGIPTHESSAPDPPTYRDTHAGYTEHLREPVYGPAFVGAVPGA